MKQLSTQDPETVSGQQKVNSYFSARSAFWKNVYAGHDVQAAIYQMRRQLVLSYVDQLPIPVGSRVLEIGCGAGITSVPIARRGFVVDAVDSVPAMLDLTNELAREAGVSQRVITSVRDAGRLGFAPETFSLVLAIGVLPWLEDCEKALQEMKAVLCSGGYLIASADALWRLQRLFDPWVILRAQLVKSARRLKLLSPPKAPRARMVSMSKFRRQLRRTGFEILEKKTFGFGPFTLLGSRLFADSTGVHLNHRLQRLADGKVPLLSLTGSQHLVLARKA